MNLIEMTDVQTIDVWHSSEMENNTDDMWHTLVIFSEPVMIGSVRTQTICSCDVPIREE